MFIYIFILFLTPISASICIDNICPGDNLFYIRWNNFSMITFTDKNIECSPSFLWTLLYETDKCPNYSVVKCLHPLNINYRLSCQYEDMMNKYSFMNCGTQQMYRNELMIEINSCKIVIRLDIDEYMYIIFIYMLITVMNILLWVRKIKNR